MRITLLTIGSRGDVQPMLALGQELIGAGHEPVIATHGRYEPLAARAGIPFAPLAEGVISQGSSTPAARRWLKSSNYLPTWVGYLQDARPVMRDRLADALRACAGSDAILACDLAVILGWQVAEHYGRPLVRVNFNLPVRPGSSQGPVAGAARAAVWRATRVWLDGVRRDVGLAPLASTEPFAELRRRGALVLRAYSPAVAEARDAGRDEVTGYWLLRDRLDPEPTPALRAFLAAGRPPVCLDFGSMLDLDPEATTRLAVDAIRGVGRRGVLITGAYRHSEVALPSDVFRTSAVPHDWLFPRCAAVVHHAGAGTIAATLRAGVPSVTVPHTGEQTRWARRIQGLGVAREPIPKRRLTGAALRAGLAVATNDAPMRARASALADNVGADAGTVRAVELLEAYLAARSPGAGGGPRVTDHPDLLRA